MGGGERLGRRQVVESWLVAAEARRPRLTGCNVPFGLGELLRGCAPGAAVELRSERGARAGFGPPGEGAVVARHDAVALVADQAAHEPEVAPVVVLNDELSARRIGFRGSADLAAPFGACIELFELVAVEAVDVVVRTNFGRLGMPGDLPLRRGLTHL